VSSSLKHKIIILASKTAKQDHSAKVLRIKCRTKLGPCSLTPFMVGTAGPWDESCGCFESMIQTYALPVLQLGGLVINNVERADYIKQNKLYEQRTHSYFFHYVYIMPPIQPSTIPACANEPRHQRRFWEAATVEHHKWHQKNRWEFQPATSRRSGIPPPNVSFGSKTSGAE
jgi:hypothetical protein